MTARDQLLRAVGSTLLTRDTGGALVPALRSLEAACAALLAEIEPQRPAPMRTRAAVLPNTRDDGHTWINSHGINKSTGKAVRGRQCAVCGRIEENHVVSKPYRRGRSS